MSCWNCQAATQAQPFCRSCGKIQPHPLKATHFDVFGLSPTVDLDVPALEKAHRELSLKLHPDRFAHADAKERRLSLEQTTALNEASRVLKDPVRRAFYVLKLQGVDLEREDSPEQRQMPMAFLEEVMELREALDAAREAKDVEKAQAMGARVEQQKKASVEEAMTALRRLISEPSDVEARRTATHALGRVRYFLRFLDEVAAIEEEAL